MELFVSRRAFEQHLPGAGQTVQEHCLEIQSEEHYKSGHRRRKYVLPIPHLQVCARKPPLNNQTGVLTHFARTLDPIFAMSVGITAAAVRINREEKEKGKSFEQSKESLRRRVDLAWKEVMGEEEGKKEVGK